MKDSERNISQCILPLRDFDWENKLSLIGINDQVALFNETIVSIMSNFIPNEAMTFDDPYSSMA